MCVCERERERERERDVDGMEGEIIFAQVFGFVQMCGHLAFIHPR